MERLSDGKTNVLNRYTSIDMATLKEERQGARRWIGSANAPEKKVKGRQNITNCDDVKEEYNADNHKSLTVPGQNTSTRKISLQENLQYMQDRDWETSFSRYTRLMT